jgi:hypothetical protein
MEYSVTKQILLDAQLPTQTKSYKPVSNEQLIDLTLAGIEKAGFKLDKEFYSSARNGEISNAKYTISNVSDNDMQLQIGWQNSYDKSLSLKFAIGSQVFICSNGMIRGDFGTFKKKHTGEIQEFAPQRIMEYISQAGEVFEQMKQDKERLKQIQISPKLRAELLGRIYFEEEIIKADQIAIIKNELKLPTHDYNSKDSAWELYNFCTFALKSAHPTNYFKQHSDIHNFFINSSGLLVDNYNEIVIPELELV